MDFDHPTWSKITRVRRIHYLSDVQAAQTQLGLELLSRNQTICPRHLPPSTDSVDVLRQINRFIISGLKDLNGALMLCSLLEFGSGPGSRNVWGNTSQNQMTVLYAHALHAFVTHSVYHYIKLKCNSINQIRTTGFSTNDGHPTSSDTHRLKYSQTRFHFTPLNTFDPSSQVHRGIEF